MFLLLHKQLLLGKSHHQELVEIGKTQGFTGSSVFFHAFTKNCRLKMIHQLRENQLAFVHKILLKGSGESYPYSNRFQFKGVFFPYFPISSDDSILPTPDSSDIQQIFLSNELHSHLRNELHYLFQKALTQKNLQQITQFPKEVFRRLP